MSGSISSGSRKNPAPAFFLKYEIFQRSRQVLSRRVRLPRGDQRLAFEPLPTVASPIIGEDQHSPIFYARLSVLPSYRGRIIRLCNGSTNVSETTAPSGSRGSIYRSPGCQGDIHRQHQGRPRRRDWPSYRVLRDAPRPLQARRNGAGAKLSSMPPCARWPCRRRLDKQNAAGWNQDGRGRSRKSGAQSTGTGHEPLSSRLRYAPKA